MSAQRDLEEKFDAAHNPIAIGDFDTAFNQVQLERLYIIGRSRIR
ncbi:MAG: hypothetical protein AAFR90_10110 [Pseudomonadota bacterium]